MYLVAFCTDALRESAISAGLQDDLEVKLLASAEAKHDSCGN